MELEFNLCKERVNPAMLKVLVITKLNNASTHYYTHMYQPEHYVSTLNEIKKLYKDEVKGLESYIDNIIYDISERNNELCR